LAGVTRVPFNRPCLAGGELGYVKEAIERGQLSANGHFTGRCEALLEGELGASRVLLTTSCTHALEMAAMLLSIEPGDEVILPSFTFVSTANAFVNYGARPVFVDVRADTLNLDEAQVERRIGPRTRAIVAVHYGGVACELDALLEIAARRKVPLVEDNAHGLFARYRGKPLGTFGVVGTQSFHETKNITCGEGGAIIVNEAALQARAEILRDKGTDRARFFRGEVDRYTWIDVGSSWGPSELQAAFLLGQLEARTQIGEQRRRAWERYDQALGGFLMERGARGPIVPAGCEQSHHLYYVMAPSLEARTALIAHLQAYDIGGIFHYQPLHLSKMGTKFGGAAGDCPVTEAAADRLLRLPLYNDLSTGDQDRVIDAVRAFFT
jgi:dTDP-4-amino-4,6-dideoxygalactose transaminase